MRIKTLIEIILFGGPTILILVMDIFCREAVLILAGIWIISLIVFVIIELRHNKYEDSGNLFFKHDRDYIVNKNDTKKFLEKLNK